MSDIIDLKAFDSDLGIEYSKYASDLMKTDLWIVKKGFVFHLDKQRLKKVVVPKGYLTDGASVPRVFWSFIPPWGRYGQAAVLHDWMCEYPGYMDGNAFVRLTRQQVDDLLLTAMTELGVDKFTRVVIWGAVRAYGFVSSGKPDKYNSKKHGIELRLLNNYESTGVWL